LNRSYNCERGDCSCAWWPDYRRKVSDGVSNVQERRGIGEQTKVAAETKAELAEEHGLDPSNPAEERRLERLAQGQAEKELDDTPSADELATDDSRAREMASEATDGLIDDGERNSALFGSRLRFAGPQRSGLRRESRGN